MQSSLNHRSRASFLSALFMGLGQIYNGQWIKGAILTGVHLSFLAVEFGSRLIEPLNSQLGLRGRSIIGHALWSITTLGERPGVRGDHSLFLLIDALIVLTVLAVFLLVYIGNVLDAWHTGKRRDQGLRIVGFKQNMTDLYEKGFAYLLLAPGTGMMLFFVVMPLLFSISIAFTNYSLHNAPPARLVSWVGFENFLSIWRIEAWRNSFVHVFGWTVAWTIFSTLSTFFLGLFLAVLLNHPRLKFRRFFRTFLILPWAIPGFISILVLRGLFNDQWGHVNQMLAAVGIAQIPWFNSIFWSRALILIVNLWLGFPWFMILCTGVLQSIPVEVYEAAEVDGASDFQQFWRITLPLVLYAVGPLLIMSFAHNFNNFNAVYLLTGGGPAVPGLRAAGGTDILITWVFKVAFDELFRYNYAAAISLVIFVIVAIISIWNFRRTRQFQEEDMIS
ncbi:MAG: ABC transporter permease subunit [Peptococcaceae bacterium]|nr:ABC transporter permease subunit [Peptococcaceae bacterium]